MGDSTQMSRREIADKMMDAAKGYLRMTGRTKREFVTPVPTSYPGGYISMLVSPLLDGSGKSIGEIRLWIYVAEDRNIPIRVRVEWTRDAFGFWYRNEIVLQNVDDPMVELLKRLKEAMFFVKITADGTVRVASMNRGGFQKIRKSRTRDKAARVGMMMG